METKKFSSPQKISLSPSIFQLISFSVLLLSHLTFAYDNTPEISLLAWIGADTVNGQTAQTSVAHDMDQDAPVTQNVSTSTYILTSEVTLVVFECKAKYPVEWEFANSKWLLLQENTFGVYITTSRRQSEDMDNPKTFTFSSQLIFLGDSRMYNGQYFCKGFDDSRNKNNFTLFWEGGPFDSAFVLSKKNLTIYLDDKYDRIIFPCHVNNPYVQVSLKRDDSLAVMNPDYTNGTTDQWTNVTSPNLEYKPEMGFIFEKRDNIDWLTPGNYKCVTATMEGDEEDAVFMTLVLNEEPNIELDTPLKGKASITKDTKRMWYECCSSSSVPPTLILHSCGDPMSCKELMPALKTQQSSLGAVPSGSGAAFNRIIFPQLAAYMNKRNGSCSSVRSFGGQYDVDMVQCIGDGVNVLRKYFSRNTKNLTIDRWDKTSLQEWVDLQPTRNINFNVKKVLNKSDTFEVYFGQSVTFQCKTSFYFFSYGIRFSIQRKDGSKQVLPDTLDSNLAMMNQQFRLKVMLLLHNPPLMASVTVNMSEEMTSLTCYVPVFNSSEWITKTISFSGKAPQRPIIGIDGDMDTDNVVWNMNDTDKTLSCTTMGEPEPHLIWTKDGNLVTGSMFNVSRHEGKYTLRVPTVTHEVQGEFKCISVNLAGKAERKFTVFVEESQVAEITTIVIVTVLILAILIGGGFVVWKALVQKKALDSLREFVYPQQEQTATTEAEASS